MKEDLDEPQDCDVRNPQSEAPHDHVRQEKQRQAPRLYVQNHTQRHIAGHFNRSERSNHPWVKEDGELVSNFKAEDLLSESLLMMDQLREELQDLQQRANKRGDIQTELRCVQQRVELEERRVRLLERSGVFAATKSETPTMRPRDNMPRWMEERFRVEAERAKNEVDDDEANL